jgi:hypothetical protein
VSTQPDRLAEVKRTFGDSNYPGGWLRLSKRTPFDLVPDAKKAPSSYKERGPSRVAQWRGC